MANSELSKIKILYIYDYFARKISAYDEASSVSVSELIIYLEQMTGVEFERKSIYADINKINDYMRQLGVVKNGDDWIYLESKRYHKAELIDEIGIDEARLLVDAINTTPFVDTGLSKKIQNLFPVYFGDDYRKSKVALVPREIKQKPKKRLLLNNIRKCIENKQVLVFEYGYMYAGSLTEKSQKTVSPLALDWTMNRYYMIAVDNDEYAKKSKVDDDITKCIRRYRIDRIDDNRIALKSKYVDFPSEAERKKYLNDLINSSLDAFSTTNMKVVNVSLIGDSRVDVIKAYSALADEVEINHITKEYTETGKTLSFNFRSGMVPTLYKHLFSLCTFEGVKLRIDDDEVREKFNKYLNKAIQE